MISRGKTASNQYILKKKLKKTVNSSQSGWFLKPFVFHHKATQRLDYYYIFTIMGKSVCVNKKKKEKSAISEMYSSNGICQVTHQITSTQKHLPQISWIDVPSWLLWQTGLSSEIKMNLLLWTSKLMQTAF